MDESFFQRKHNHQAARYVCQVVAEKWKPNLDVQQVMAGLCTMAWALDQLPEGSEIGRRLRIQCAATACYLFDKKVEVLTTGKN
jgi:streptomycin 6-kinase